MNLPNTFIIGAMKSGSTSLHSILNNHPDVFMSELKEINYFIEEINYSKGIEWYRSHFPEKKAIMGESSIGYTKRHQFDGVPERIWNTIGKDAKFIYIMRDPIERTISHFIDSMLYHQLDKEDYPEINECLVQPKNIYVESSKYFYQLEAYLKYYDISSFHFLTFEEFKKDPFVQVNGIFKFLGLLPLSREKFVFESMNSTENKKLKTTTAKKLLNNPVAKGIKMMLPKKMKDAVVQNSYYQKLSRKPIVKKEFELTTTTTEYLMNYFRADIDSLEQITGKQYDEWFSKTKVKK